MPNASDFTADLSRFPRWVDRDPPQVRIACRTHRGAGFSRTFRVHSADGYIAPNKVGSAVDLEKLASNAFADIIGTTFHLRSPP
jgi:hypothetical protein